MMKQDQEEEYKSSGHHLCRDDHQIGCAGDAADRLIPRSTRSLRPSEGRAAATVQSLEMLIRLTHEMKSMRRGRAKHEILVAS